MEGGVADVELGDPKLLLERLREGRRVGVATRGGRVPGDNPGHK